jgi:hypothetical protein
MNELVYSTPVGPKTLGQILDRTYRLTRAHFTLLVGIAVIPTTLLFVVIALMEAAIWLPMIRQFPKPLPPQEILRNFTPAIIIPVFVLVTLTCLAITSIYLAAASYAAIQADAGVRVTIRESWALAWKRAARYLWLLVLMYVYAALPILVLELVVLVGSNWLILGRVSVTPAMYFLIPLVVILYIAAVVYGVLMGLRLSLAFPACVAEELAARPAIKRSFQLTRNAKGRIFAVILVVYAILYAVMLVAEVVAMVAAVVVIFAAVALRIHPVAPWSYIGLGLLGICGLAAIILSTAVTYAALTTALAVLYRDQRLRIDGLLPATPQAGGLV